VPSKYPGIEQEIREIKKRYRQERFSWLKRPRIDTAIIEEFAKDEELAKIEKQFGGQFAQRRRREIGKRANRINKLANSLGLSGERLVLFKQLVLAYRREPTIKNYVRFRREFDQAEIRVTRFHDKGAVPAFSKKLREQGIEPQLVYLALDAHEPAIDVLSLCLLEKLIARDNLPKIGPGHIERRRKAISDVTVNYLVSMMLEAMDSMGNEIRMPASLIVLIRHQLCGTNPDLYKEYLLRAKRLNARIAAAQKFPQGKISVRKLAVTLGVSRGTAARWLADKEFLEWLEDARTWDLPKPISVPPKS
jgi:hypothetical protein